MRKIKRGKMENRRGLSAVVVTLLLVMLSIVLVGVVFVVVNNLVTSGTSQISFGAKCQSSSVEVLAATCNQAGTSCNATVKRDMGSDVIDGVTLVFYNNAGDSNVSNWKGNIPTPASQKISGMKIDIANVTKIDAAVYFLDKSGKINSCPGTSEFTQVALV